MLEKIKNPSDIRDLSYDELKVLAGEIRETIIDTVSKNGGHLASNLGMVEATIALHRVFDSPNDKIIFDVSHQSYTHKLLTGRYDIFPTLRQYGGMSGFTNRNESDHDILSLGHSGSSISSALGIAAANKLKGSSDYTVAVVGDGSLTNGMIYEALNNCGDKKLNLIILINDNEMSISKNVGGLHSYLTKIRTSSGYFTFKRKFEILLSSIPVIGNSIARMLKLFKDSLKRMFVRDTLFEDLGLVYVGPVDGHNIEKLSRVLEEAKNKHQCCVVHMRTKKGYGYTPAENKPYLYHGVGNFDAAYGIDPDETGESFSAEFGKILCELSEKDDKICAITAAMGDGTGIYNYSKKFPDRFFDVGIAEEHAITFAGGLSAAGMKPVVALYSTFAQRVYDQLQHDVAVQELPLILALDRAGLVQSDGITHQGIFDYSIFSTVPNTTIYAPTTYGELRGVIESSIDSNCGIKIIRYPKGTEIKDIPEMFSDENGMISYTDNVKSKTDAVIITYGRLTKTAFDAAATLLPEYNVAVIKLLQVFPVDYDSISGLIENTGFVYILDESYIEGGLGQKLSANLNTDKPIHVNAINDFVEHGSLTELMEHCGFTKDKVAADIKNLLN